MEKIMKNLMMQIGLIFGLVITLGIVSAQAQTAIRYKTEIPFDFNIGEKTYQSGVYFINISNSNILKVEDAKGKNLLVKFVSLNSIVSDTDLTKMVFNCYDNQYFLAKIGSRDFGVTFSKSNTETQLAKNQNSQIKTVSVNVKKRNK